MKIMPYTLMIYGLTIVISLLVVCIMILINKLVSRKERRSEKND